MKTNSQKTNNTESIIDKQLKRIHIKKLAKLSGFYKKKAQKNRSKKFHYIISNDNMELQT